MLTLQQPNVDLAISYFDFIEEMRQLGEYIWEEIVPLPNETNSQFVERLLQAEFQAPDGMVTHTTYWACEENKVVGRIDLRHHLNDSLKELGGHIGYEVRPSCRSRGLATEMLRQVLQTPKAKGIGAILITCAPNNIASNRAIVKNGGILTKTAFVEKWQRDTNYYLIEVKA